MGGLASRETVRLVFLIVAWHPQQAGQASCRSSRAIAAQWGKGPLTAGIRADWTPLRLGRTVLRRGDLSATMQQRNQRSNSPPHLERRPAAPRWGWPNSRAEASPAATGPRSCSFPSLCSLRSSFAKACLEADD